MARRPVVVAGASAALFVVLLVLVAARAAPVVRFDAAVSAAALRFALDHPAWQVVLRAFTATGAPTVVIAATVAAAAVLASRGRRDPVSPPASRGIRDAVSSLPAGRGRRDAVFLLTSVLGATGLRLVLAAAVARPRPAERLSPVIGWSFPSGHSTASAAVALAAVVVAWPLLRRRWLFAVAALGWAALIGASRVALVVHWPSDVLGAWLMVIPVVTAATPLRRRSSSGPPAHPPATA